MNSTQSDLKENRFAVRQIPKHVDKISFGIASVYFLLVLMWVFTEISDQEKEKSQKVTPSAADAQFIAYLQQSLNVLNQPATEKTLVNPEDKQSSTVAINPPSPPTQQKVIERVYVPMYPPNQSNSAPSSLQPPSPSSNSNNNLPPAPPFPAATSKPSSVPVLTPNQNTFSVSPDIAANSQLPQDAGHQLVGVLESGQQSTAIFTFNGISRRFEIGEAVGNSGGILMGVQNQKAIVYHNGQTKHIEVGQAF
ncbi:hypothetical protein cce_4178 [Crocosphaera subtropica ATCC 51142]|uniref:Type II secretion system protein GspC N-terminal domain-containing protein n=1 Tax=Crocosphaera subtropica (strain ATCC 51142 / BH68) TaxID=43989 RepID=B1WRT5_CROS5|nr:hypothetical protein [Crocosphaera subtropica]ACB53526.1 hypothetical protein cce_4178 [Crocosphaera subtropica ATCC 51142]